MHYMKLHRDSGKLGKHYMHYIPRFPGDLVWSVAPWGRSKCQWLEARLKRLNLRFMRFAFLFDQAWWKSRQGFLHICKTCLVKTMCEQCRPLKRKLRISVGPCFVRTRLASACIRAICLVRFVPQAVRQLVPSFVPFHTSAEVSVLQINFMSCELGLWVEPVGIWDILIYLWWKIGHGIDVDKGIANSAKLFLSATWCEVSFCAILWDVFSFCILCLIRVSCHYNWLRRFYSDARCCQRGQRCTGKIPSHSALSFKCQGHLVCKELLVASGKKVLCIFILFPDECHAVATGI